MQTGVIIRRLDPVNLCDFKKRKLSGALHREMLPRSRRRTPACHDSLLGAVECPLESSVVEWLQEIIEGSCVESPQRVFVISRDKYDGGRHLAQHLEHVKPVALRHLDVEEDHVRLQVANLQECLMPEPHSRTISISG